MWGQYGTEKQIKQMCGTCQNAGRIVGYWGRGKRRKMELWCEVHQKGVRQDHICEAYKDEKGMTLYNQYPTKE